MEIDTSSEKGWTVLADLTDKLQKVNDEIDVKEMEWLELSEVLEGLEVEEESKDLSQYNKQII
jgi:ATP-binding cassette subfamily F protein uup